MVVINFHRLTILSQVCTYDWSRWHQVMDRPDSYQERAATTMIGHVLLRGMERDWLDEANATLRRGLGQRRLPRPGLIPLAASDQ